MVHVSKTIALMSCLHVFFSAVLSGARKCFGTGKRLNILGSVHDYSLGRMRPMAYLFTVNRLHYTFRPSRAEFLETRTNFTRARTTF